MCEGAELGELFEPEVDPADDEDQPGFVGRARVGRQPARHSDSGAGPMSNAPGSVLGARDVKAWLRLDDAVDYWEGEQPPDPD